MTNEKWGNVKLLQRKTEPLICKNVDHVAYVADEFGGPTYLTLQCDCGFTWTIDEQHFQGKKLTRTCGRPECTVGTSSANAKPLKKLGRPPVADRGTAVCIYVPGSLLLEAFDLSRKRNVAIGQIFAQCFQIAKEQI